MGRTPTSASPAVSKWGDALRRDRSQRVRGSKSDMRRPMIRRRQRIIGRRMKITNVRVVELVGEARSGLALYEIARRGGPAGEASPHRWTFTQIETDEGLVGVTHGGSAETKAAGRLLIGEDPTRIEYLWEKVYWALRPNVRPVALLDLALWDLLGKIENKPVYKLLGGPTRERI